jgi:hypothetical protein
MPQTPNERIAALQREYEASQQRLADINRTQAERERQWAIEDAERKKEEELARRARKAQKELDRKEREGRKKEKLRSGKAPPRDKDPPIFGGNNKPKKTRYVSLFPVCRAPSGAPEHGVISLRCFFRTQS